MKKKLLVLGVISLVVLSIVLLRENIMLKSKINVDTDNAEKIKHKDMLSMMLEIEAGSGNYEMTTRESWPTSGYKFNSALSKCENSGELSWDDENKRVLMSGNVSDRCYVYFDKIMTLSEFVIAQYNGVQGNNNIYYHDSTLENGAGDNSYRYAGSSDTTNNYVCFGSDAATCPEDNLYRIIGVFDGKIKLIKAIAEKSKAVHWSNLSSCPSENAYAIGPGEPTSDNGCNDWKYSDLNTEVLNTNFLNDLDDNWKNMITNTIWKVGDDLSVGLTPLAMFTAEIKNATKTYGPSDGTSKIGLMYASDYGYVASPSAWTTTLKNYNTDVITSVNWLYSKSTEWIISTGDEGVFYLSYGELDGQHSSNSHSIRPVFYLLSSITYKSGNGTQDSPIRIN